MEVEQQATICSLDLGSYTCKISALDKKGFQTLTNEANFRETPSVVGFTNMERLIGQHGSNKMKTNFKNTIRCPQRLIGSQNNKNTIQQILKFSYVKTIVDNKKLQFQIQTQNKQIHNRFTPQQILIALLTKVSQIIQSHGLNAAFLAISVPSHLNYIDRSILYQCGIAAGFNQIVLIDQWMAITTQYAFFRLKQLESQTQQRYILFIDAGHSSFTVNLCQIGRNRATLIKQQSLKFTGSVNVDYLILQFYAENMKKKSGLDLYKNPKAVVKMLQYIEKQRKILSANSEHHLSIQCIIGDQDFDYNMRRQQFQNLIIPILGEIATPLNNMKQFIQTKQIKLKSIQLLGGASRIPFFQNMMSNIFKMDLSKTLNASESIARGSNIGAALRMGFIKDEGFNVNDYNLFDIEIYTNCLQNTNKEYLKQLKLYDKSCGQILFQKGQIKLPVQRRIQLKQDSQYECVIAFKRLPQQTQLLDQAQCYFKIKAPCSLKIVVDNNKTIGITYQNNQTSYEINITGIQKQKWQKYKIIEQELRQRDHDIVQVYHRKNEYQALLYDSRDKLNTIYQNYVQEGQKQTLLDMIKDGQIWVLNHHEIANLKQYTQRLQTLSSLIQSYANRKQNHQKTQHSYNQFIKFANKAISTLKNKQKIQEIEIMKASIQELYIQSCASKWENPKITGKQCTEARQQLIKSYMK